MTDRWFSSKKIGYMSKPQRYIIVSISQDLIYDFRRDVKDLGMDQHMKVHNLKDYHQSKILSDQGELKSCIMFCTYSLLIRKAVYDRNGIQTTQSRLDQICEWFANGNDEGDGVLALVMIPTRASTFDECVSCLLSAFSPTVALLFHPIFI